ncbi:MAG: hypothetical protein AAF721_35925 [Myxococcota bacterium]
MSRLVEARRWILPSVVAALSGCGPSAVLSDVDDSGMDAGGLDADMTGGDESEGGAGIPAPGGDDADADGEGGDDPCSGGANIDAGWSVNTELPIDARSDPAFHSDILDLMCTVDEVLVSPTADSVTTRLICPWDDGFPYAILLEHPVVDAEALPWATRDDVLFSVHVLIPVNLADSELTNLSLKTPEGDLLLVAINAEEVRDSIIAPATVAVDREACAPTGGAVPAGVSVAIGAETDEGIGERTGLLTTADQEFDLLVGRAAVDDVGALDTYLELLLIAADR